MLIEKKFESVLNDNINTHLTLLKLTKEINKVIKLIEKTIAKGGKIIFCGNGGSAADAQHLAAEYPIRLRPDKNRKAIAAIALAQDTSTITACGNDIGFENLYSRNLEALGNKKDILICISTSGQSLNLIKAAETARKKGIEVVGFLGINGGKLKNKCDQKLIVKSQNTARIQECHIFLGHFILTTVEDNLLRNKKI